MASPDLRVRLGTLAFQTAAVMVLAAATSGSLAATRVAASALVAVLLLAFAMHVIASVMTRSAMPGLTTSILPGAPAAVALMVCIWTG